MEKYNLIQTSSILNFNKHGEWLFPNQVQRKKIYIWELK